MMDFLTRLLGRTREHPLIASCIVITVLAIAANIVLWRTRSGIAREHEQARERGREMLAALTSRSRINTDVALLGEALAVLEANLASEESMEANLGYFYGLEKASRIRLARIDQLAAAPAVTGSPYKGVPVSLQVAGSYRNLLGFLRELETGPRVLRVRDLRFERSAESESELTGQLTVELLGRP